MRLRRSLAPTLLAALALPGLAAGAAVGDAPVWALPSVLPVEATGPSGATAEYEASAVDENGEELDVTCSPQSGSVFALGETTVTCQAGEDERRFTVVVADTTAPSLVPPAPLELVSATPVARDDPAIAAFLAGATASDLVDPAPAVTYEAPASFPVGGTAEVTFTATDRSGNSSSATSTVTVAALSRPPAPLDLHAALGSGLVRLAWRVPADAQVERFEITRTARDGAPVTIYTGTAATFLDRGVENGITYRYAVSSVDASEMRSDEVLVAARPVASRLVTPLDGARLVAPPLLRWTAPARATYYNVQLWRNGRKILSAWPSSPRLRLHASWTYRGRTFRLVPGTYVWYVWPGYGRRASARYGKALGHRAFFVTG